MSIASSSQRRRSFHRSPYAIAALKSGRPVYGEKTLGFTAQDCHDVLDAVAQTRQIYQVGHQMRYASWGPRNPSTARWQAILGEPTQIYAYWHRRDDWRREVPHPQLEHLLNWRLYRESSGGLLEELRLSSHRYCQLGIWRSTRDRDGIFKHRRLITRAHGWRQRAGCIWIHAGKKIIFQLDHGQCDDGGPVVDLRHRGQHPDHA